MFPFKVQKLLPADSQRLKLEIGLLAFFALFVFFAKVLLINQYGNATPFWDQWDAEAAYLYKPYLEGNLSFSDLLAPHNEHRIFTTRLLALGLLELNETWNPLLQMVVNAAIHVAALCLIIILIVRVVGRQHLTLLLAFAAILFSMPYAWENTLAGFQSQFYFVLFFGALCLWLLIMAAPLSVKWWLGVLAGVLAFLSLASGLFAVAAASCVMLAQYVLGVRRSNFQLFGIFLLFLFVYVGFSLTPVMEGHEAYKANSFGQFFQALWQVLTWPEEGSWLLGSLLYLPALIFGLLLMVARPPASDRQWFLLALVAWCIGQCVSLAYGRATGPTSSRYLDLIAIGLLVNFSVLLLLIGKIASRWRHLARFFGVGWVVSVITGLVGMYPVIDAQLTGKQSLSRIQEEHVRSYLCDGNVWHLQGKPLFHIPYPDAVRLQHLLDDPSIRRILPENIYAGRSDRSRTVISSAPLCPFGKLSSAFSIQHWSGEVDKVSVALENVDSNGWRGSDYDKSQFEGLKVIGSLAESDSDTGYLLVRVRRGDRLLYRSGPSVARQSILVDAGGVAQFYADAPASNGWSLMEFGGSELPAEFDVVFVDAGTGWGEWSAIAVGGVAVK